MKFKSEPVDPHLSAATSAILCDACGTSNPPSRCANCHLTFYCHEACAKNHWQVHKTYCKSPADVLKASHLIQAATSTSSCNMCEGEFDDVSSQCLYHFQEKSATSKCCDRTYCLQCMDYYQIYTSSLWIDSSSSSSNSSANDAGVTKCPCCRMNTTTNAAEATEQQDMDASQLLHSQLNQAAFWTAKASSTRDNAGSSESKKSNKFAHKALDHVEAFLDQNTGTTNQAAKILQGRILGTLLGEYDLGLLLLRESLHSQQTQKPSSGTVVDELLKQVQDCMKNGNVEKAEGLLDQVQSLRNQKYGGVLVVQPSELMDLQLMIADIELKSEDYAAAQRSLTTLMLGEDDKNNKNGMTPNQQLQAYLRFAKCCYETKEYKKAMESSKLAIDMNRHYPQVYKYLILSHLGAGEMTLAKGAASRAVLYEAPWDPRNHQRTLFQYQELYGNE